MGQNLASLGNMNQSQSSFLVTKESFIQTMMLIFFGTPSEQATIIFEM